KKTARRNVSHAERRQVAGGHFQSFARQLRRHPIECLHKIGEPSIVETVCRPGKEIGTKEESCSGLKALEPFFSGIDQRGQAVDNRGGNQILEIHQEARSLGFHSPTPKPALDSPFHAARRFRLQQQFAAFAFTDSEVNRGGLECVAIVDVEAHWVMVVLPSSKDGANASSSKRFGAPGSVNGSGAGVRYLSG